LGLPIFEVIVFFEIPPPHYNPKLYFGLEIELENIKATKKIELIILINFLNSIFFKN
jgi:hypothetical protein